jgi:hypothetical protein
LEHTKLLLVKQEISVYGARHESNRAEILPAHRASRRQGPCGKAISEAPPRDRSYGRTGAQAMKRGRKTMREILARNNAADRFLAAMAGKPPQAQAAIPPPPKPRARSASGKPLERHVLRAVLDALRHHPRVAFAWRMQSGLFQEGDRYIRVGTPGLPDVVAMLKNSGQLVAVEVKREGGYISGAQEIMLQNIRFHGGRAGVARSVEDAIAIIEGKNA